ncbi:hypothetical protein BGAL_0233g00050 [Botrytis galanthina]|uniref:Uncharacterized protein n=1 Tax=Botrytis galanthina TaxID=278940 RepID=A0A4S8QU35_9HELO|nr:hypothetical protein BGAL_0233g00050 [Botrytis galanthina]
MIGGRGVNGKNQSRVSPAQVSRHSKGKELNQKSRELDKKASLFSFRHVVIKHGPDCGNYNPGKSIATNAIQGLAAPDARTRYGTGKMYLLKLGVPRIIRIPWVNEGENSI